MPAVCALDFYMDLTLCTIPLDPYCIVGHKYCMLFGPYSRLHVDDVRCMMHEGKDFFFLVNVGIIVFVLMLSILLWGQGVNCAANTGH